MQKPSWLRSQKQSSDLAHCLHNDNIYLFICCCYYYDYYYYYYYY